MDTLHTSHPTTIFKTRWKFGEQGFQLALSSCRLDMLGTVFKLKLLLVGCNVYALLCLFFQTHNG